MADKTLFWFRQDLRLSDNPGLYEAAQNGQVIACYIFDEDGRDSFSMGAASRWWFHHSLSALNGGLGGKLNIYQGNPLEIILRLIANHSIREVYWNRCYGPYRVKVDTEIKSLLQRRGGLNVKVLTHPFYGSLGRLPRMMERPIRFLRLSIKKDALRVNTPGNLYQRPISKAF